MGPYRLSTLEPETEAFFICLKNAYLFQNWGSKTCNFRLHNTVDDRFFPLNPGGECFKNNF